MAVSLYDCVAMLDFFDDFLLNELISFQMNDETTRLSLSLILKIIHNSYHEYTIGGFDDNWLSHYNEIVFYQIFRLQKGTFHKLLTVLLDNDDYGIIKKKYRGGNLPVAPEKSLLIFLWFMSKQDTLNCIAEIFRILPSTVMNITNEFLYVLKKLKGKYIFWPKTIEEFDDIKNGFHHYPGTIGAIDGCHIKLKVPMQQQDSYINRSMAHSINSMAICNSKKQFTYIFVGFPGSAHDARVFTNSLFVREIERGHKQKFFPSDDYHIIGDSAFPLTSWLMKPYRNPTTHIQKHHNSVLSSDRISIEHTFGILKGRWRRLQFINTYSVSKAIEIVTVACILHNFCYLNNDVWEEVTVDERREEGHFYDAGLEFNLGVHKRNNIAMSLLQ